MRFISHHEIEQGLICDGVRVVVVCKPHMGDLINPGTGVASVEDPKVDFNLLIDMFYLTIRLRAVGSGEEKVIVKELVKFFGEGGCELWTTIRDDLVVESKVEVDFMEKEGSHPFSSDCFLSEAENLKT